ncbi:MAG: hypothetical protein N2037_05155 [Acidimicrobiales bacterium]|nr:hypothetical protein [Acidimicrobiales bacterium]
MAEFLLLAASLTAAIALIALTRKERKSRALAAATVDLRVDRTGIQRELADGRIEGVCWADVTEVEVLTANQGIHATYGGVVIIGDGHERGCLVPLDRIEEVRLVEHLARLPGFDLERFAAALEMRPPKRTVCWIREAPTGDPAS